jgi:hypothetical protein
MDRTFSYTLVEALAKSFFEVPALPGLAQWANLSTTLFEGVAMLIF